MTTIRGSRAVGAATAAATLILLFATPAYADVKYSCGDTGTYMNAILSVSSGFAHRPEADQPYHRGRARAHPSSKTLCSDLWSVSEVIDHYIATYADKLVSGSWDECSSKVKGWGGGTLHSGDWWVALIQNDTWYSGAGSCQWGTYSIRSRALGKAQYNNGHIWSRWTYATSHPHI
jgi:hypothetical protein